MPKSSLFDLDEGIENIPVIKAPAQAVKTVASTAAKYTKQQARALTKAFISQLYGSSSSLPMTDDDQHADTTTADPLAQVKKTQSKPQSAGMTNTTTTKTPEEEEKLEETRRKLQQQHTTDYVTPVFGKIGDIEQEMRKRREERKQAEQKRQQEEEEEKQRKQKEKIRMQNQQLVVPKGKVRGQPPAILRRSQTKAETNRGVSG